MIARAFIILALLSAAACAPRISPELKAELDRRAAENLAARDAGRMSWVQWSQENERLYIQGGKEPGLREKTIFLYSHALAAEVDAKRVTPEAYRYQMAQKLQNEIDAVDQRAQMRRLEQAATRQRSCYPAPGFGGQMTIRCD